MFNGNSSYGAAQSTGVGPAGQSDARLNETPGRFVSWWKFGIYPIQDQL
jgi:hypothetical protein